MSRPDWESVKRAAGEVFTGAGETATVRRYVSGTTGSPQFGVASVLESIPLTITGLFYTKRDRERDLPGGQSYANPQLMMSMPSALHPRDEILWRGQLYRAAGNSIPEIIGGRMQFTIPLVQSGPTG